MPGSVTYGCTKSFVTYLCEGLGYEVKDKIDVMSYNPGFVTTKLSKKRDTGPVTISEARAAEVCFRDLGCTTKTHGSFRHELLSSIVYWAPKSLLNARGWAESQRIMKAKEAKRLAEEK